MHINFSLVSYVGEKVMVAFERPQYRKKGGKLIGERNKVKLIYLRFERGQVGNGRRGQDAIYDDDDDDDDYGDGVDMITMIMMIMMMMPS